MPASFERMTKSVLFAIEQMNQTHIHSTYYSRSNNKKSEMTEKHYGFLLVKKKLVSLRELDIANVIIWHNTQNIDDKNLCYLIQYHSKRNSIWCWKEPANHNALVCSSKLTFSKSSVMETPSRTLQYASLKTKLPNPAREKALVKRLPICACKSL